MLCSGRWTLWLHSSPGGRPDVPCFPCFAWLAIANSLAGPPAVPARFALCRRRWHTTPGQSTPRRVSWHACIYRAYQSGVVLCPVAVSTLSPRLLYLSRFPRRGPHLDGRPRPPRHPQHVPGQVRRYRNPPHQGTRDWRRSRVPSLLPPPPPLPFTLPHAAALLPLLTRSAAARTAPCCGSALLSGTSTTAAPTS